MTNLLPLFETSDCTVHYLHGEGPVWVIFGALGARSPGNVKTVQRLGAAGFFITAKNDNWYQTFDPLPLWLMLRGFSGPKIGFGVSMGAFAALVFADRLRLDRVFACSPQVVINPDLTPDRRWLSDWNELKNNGQLYQPDASTVRVPSYIFLDPEDKMDVWHASQLGESAREIRLPYASHAIANELVSRGVWGEVAEAIQNSDDEKLAEAIKLFKKHRRNSYTRVVGLAQKAEKLGKLSLSEALFMKAIAVTPNRHHAYHFLGVLYAQTGRLIPALTMAEQAIVNFNVADGPMAGLFETLAHRHAQLSDLDAAEQAFLDGIRRAPDGASLRIRYREFVAATGRESKMVS